MCYMKNLRQRNFFYNMAIIKYVVLGLLFVTNYVCGQHENIPYENVGEICITCNCLSARDFDKTYHFALQCANKGFTHILARWPQEFGMDHSGDEIVATFSYNKIAILQQVPATNATLSLSCRSCGVTDLQAPTFIDVPNIVRLDLSENQIDELTPDIFRGPYRPTSYEPIAMRELYLKQNKITSLDKRLFEHIPELTIFDIGNNPLNVLSDSTIEALTSALKLQVLDLSFTGIKIFPAALGRGLKKLHTLNLAGNELTTVPDSLRLGLAGKSLQNLNLFGNRLKTLNIQSFFELTNLQQLNISNMSSLVNIEKGAFGTLPNLKQLLSSRNSNLGRFDLYGLLRAKNLTVLDISNSGLTTLWLDEDVLPPIILVNDNSTMRNANQNSQPWPKLKTFAIGGNPWFCNCSFLRTIEFIGARSCSYNDCGTDYDAGEERCSKPYVLAGKQIFNMSATKICSMAIPKELHIIEEDPPRFLRHDYIILTVIIASVVIILGLVIGFLVVCIRRRLKSDDYGTEPIRYTSVRNSTLAAFPPINSANDRGASTRTTAVVANT